MYIIINIIHNIHIMNISKLIDDCFIMLCVPSKNCGIIWGASCIIINCHHCFCKKNSPCRNNQEHLTETNNVNIIKNHMNRINT